MYFALTRQQKGNWCFRCSGGSRYCGLTRDDDYIIIQAENGFYYFLVLTFYRVLESEERVT